MIFAKSKSTALLDRSGNWILSIAIICLLAIIGLKVFFDRIQDELSAQSANERARLFVGEEIVRGIHGIEKDIYMMAAATNLAASRRIQKSVFSQLDKLRHDLNVLQNGGTVRRQVLLNLEGRDEMVREAIYKPTSQGESYVMELIEISPLLDQIQNKALDLEKLLMRGWEYQERGDKQAFFTLHDEIDAFLKHIPPYFDRLEENANRLFFDGSARLRELEAELAEQRRQLRIIEMAVMALVIGLAGLASFTFVRRIGDASRKLEEALAEMSRAKDEAERASRVKSQFVSRMSHELRTPLNAIIGFAELLEGEQLTGSQKNFASLITSSGRHLMELINAVLDHAKIESGQLMLETISYDLAETLNEVRSIILNRANAKGIKFVAEVTGNLPGRVVGDPTRLRQVLINLMANAIKFTEQGAVELRVAVDGGTLVFSIRDTGIGMDEEALGRLFRPFAQADETVTRKYGGTGLGLAISKELVDAMGGQIEVESAVGVGTCFWIRLPYRPAAETEAVSQPVAPPMPTELSSLSNLICGRVLVVDDNPVNLQLGRAMLERMGLSCDTAVSGEEAVRFIAERLYRLVLMDMEMPGMDGLSATRRIREEECHRGDGRLVIIATTANALVQDRDRCLEAGMDGYVAKPISIARLEAEIRRLFGSVAVAVPDAPASPLGSADGIYDRDRAIDMIGDEEVFVQIAEMYIAGMPKTLAEFDTALAAGDWKTLTRSAHTLKSLFATFAAAGSESHARQLEHAAMAGDESLCRAFAPVVRSHAEALALALRR